MEQTKKTKENYKVKGSNHSRRIPSVIHSKNLFDNDKKKKFKTQKSNWKIPTWAIYVLYAL